MLSEIAFGNGEMCVTKTLLVYEKRKPFLLCVDSDGCAMDTMNIKHFRCFGPCFADEWGIEGGRARERALRRWNEINLYERTRGINRFKALALILTELYPDNDDIAAFLKWANEAKELSERALEREIAGGASAVFEKALNWSRAVNKCIGELSEDEKQAFSGVKEAFEAAKAQFDIAVVSSANFDAVAEEWERSHLLEDVDVLTTQRDGSKAHCISELLKKGYAKERVLMVGDAPGDLAAAEENGVSFYPVLVRLEKESWARLPALLQKFVKGEAAEELFALRQRFFDNLRAD